MAVANTMAALRVAMQCQDQAILAETRTALALARAELAKKEEELVQVRAAAEAAATTAEEDKKEMLVWEEYAVTLQEKLDTLALSWRDDADVIGFDAIRHEMMSGQAEDGDYERCGCAGTCWDCI